MGRSKQLQNSFVGLSSFHDYTFIALRSDAICDYSSPQAKRCFRKEASMAGQVKAIPEGYEGATPYLIVKGADKALDFYHQAFGAKEIMRMPGPEGRIGHAEISIGKAIIMLADEFPQM